ncbi:hypothetical protein M427DRAFT_286660 [Gonapodya prolifera JEL478]|uniref:GATA-type domain-containing protein n=1 Tax=Gonapodya prolifera (strain JEL478) TaxID=1344416 RepID=A0A139AJI1_GONPJ|nr:hypothetical protein M427DRAFT_286660 [Gonapodya prolifera JEL478]|eukprot:KXS16868.1 hypothetical protein M427DRAFT_286660 [Gonapodya prolifera JEL478]
MMGTPNSGSDDDSSMSAPGAYPYDYIPRMSSPEGSTAGKRLPSPDPYFEPETGGRKCRNCKATTTARWRKLDEMLLCNACFQYKQTYGVSRPYDVTKRRRVEPARVFEKLAPPEIVCSNCQTSTTTRWRKRNGEDYCNACYQYEHFNGQRRPVGKTSAQIKNKTIVQNALWRADPRRPEADGGANVNTEETPWHVLTPMPPRERQRLQKAATPTSSTNSLGASHGETNSGGWQSSTYDRVVVGRGAAAVVHKEFVDLSKRVNDGSFVAVERPEPSIPHTRRKVTMVRDPVDDDSASTTSEIVVEHPEPSPSSRRRYALLPRSHYRLRVRSQRAPASGDGPLHNARDTAIPKSGTDMLSQHASTRDGLITPTPDQASTLATNYKAALSNMSQSSLLGLLLPQKPKLFLSVMSSGSSIPPTWFASQEALLAGFATPDGDIGAKLVSKQREIETTMDLPLAGWIDN